MQNSEIKSGSGLPLVWLCAFSMLLLVSCGDKTRTAGPKRVILISMDTVRADHVSGYGPADTTPQLSSIASEGVRFADFYSASTYTIPSTMSILTGLDPQEHGMDSRVTALSPEVPLLAELMTDAGYKTQAFQEGGYVAGRFGFERGFKEYREVPRIAAVGEALPDVTGWMRENADEPYFLFLQTYAAHFPYGGLSRYRDEHPERGLPDAEQLAKLRAEIEGKDGPVEKRRFYALINYFADREEDQVGRYKQLMADFPATEHFSLDVQQIKRSYDERIRMIDAAIGQIRDTLIELGQWEDTLLVVVSDHGEAFFEHGLERHDYVPFNECIEVPLVISYPRLLRERTEHVVEGLAWHLDLMPTILALVGIPAPTGLQGRDLTPVLMDEEQIEPERAIFPAVLRPAFRERLPLRRIVIQGDDKWVEGHEHFGDAEGFLFNLANDPGELVNLREAHRARFDELAELANQYEAPLQARLPIHQQTRQPVLPNGTEIPLNLSPEEQRKIEDLGYAGDDDQ